MIADSRFGSALAGILVVLGTCAADEPLSRVEVGKLGKAATALLEVKDRQVYGSAFCVHPSGLFLTNEHMARGSVTLILNSGQKDEKSYAAKVVRADADADLALLRIEGVKGLSALTLGSDQELAELLEVVAVGFPFGTALAFNRKENPAVSINAGSITSLRRNGDQLHRIQLDVALNPGNSGGPVLDRHGHVIAVVVAGVQGSGVNFAIPVNVVSRFLTRPDIAFEPPVLNPGNVFTPVRFEARISPLVPSPDPLSVELILKPQGGAEKSYRMELSGDAYRVAAQPLPAPSGPTRLRLLARFDDGLFNAVVPDHDFKIGERSLRLSDVRRIQFRPASGVNFNDGRSVTGPVTGLDAVPVIFGGRPTQIDLSRALEARIAPDINVNQVWYTLVVRQGGREILRQAESLAIQGLLPAPAAPAGPTGIKLPALEANSVERKLGAPAVDVAVGGGGRYLILHLQSLGKLAVFDVNAAEVTGYIPMKEAGARFAAGLEDVVVLLPSSGAIERWNLKTLQREIVVPLTFKGGIRALAMGSASKGPLLLLLSGAQQFDRGGFALLHVETMRWQEIDLRQQPMMGNFAQDVMHMRASANGRVFAMWCSSHSPSGIGVVLVSDAGIQSFYAHTGAGYVLPTPDGSALYTLFGAYAPKVAMMESSRWESDPMLPACHGEFYLSLPPVVRPGMRQRPATDQPGQQPAAKPAVATVRAPGRARPIATLSGINLIATPEEGHKHDFTFDKRVHLIPDAQLIITIPASDDRLVLHHYGAEATEPPADKPPEKKDEPGKQK